MINWEDVQKNQTYIHIHAFRHIHTRIGSVEHRDTKSIFMGCYTENGHQVHIFCKLYNLNMAFRSSIKVYNIHRVSQKESIAHSQSLVSYFAGDQTTRVVRGAITCGQFTQKRKNVQATKLSDVRNLRLLCEKSLKCGGVCGSR